MYILYLTLIYTGTLHSMNGGLTPQMLLFHIHFTHTTWNNLYNNFPWQLPAEINTEIMKTFISQPSCTWEKGIFMINLSFCCWGRLMFLWQISCNCCLAFSLSLHNLLYLPTASLKINAAYKPSQVQKSDAWNEMITVHGSWTIIYKKNIYGICYKFSSNITWFQPPNIFKMTPSLWLS